MPIINDINDLEKITVADVVRYIADQIRFQQMMLDGNDMDKKPLSEQDRDIDHLMGLTESIAFLAKLKETLVGMGYERVYPLELNGTETTDV